MHIISEEFFLQNNLKIWREFFFFIIIWYIWFTDNKAEFNQVSLSVKFA